jgi:hypothetical protein
MVWTSIPGQGRDFGRICPVGPFTCFAREELICVNMVREQTKQGGDPFLASVTELKDLIRAFFGDV